MFFIIYLFLLVFAGTAQAQSFYCQTTGQVVNTGDTQDQVKAACGQPVTVTTREDQSSNTSVSEEWIYEPQLLINEVVRVRRLPRLIIVITDNKVTEIISNNPAAIGLYCPGQSIAVGQLADQIRLACGYPFEVRTRQTAQTTSKTLDVWTYNNGPNIPQTVFEFSQGRLVNINTI